MTIQVDIVTPDRSLFSGEVDMVTLPGMSGQMGILHGHAPLLSTLDIGEIILHRGQETQFIAVGGGVVEVRPDKVTILAETAEHAAEIDVSEAEAARERARHSVAEAPSPSQRGAALLELRRSTLRLKVAERGRIRHREAPHFRGEAGG